MIAAKTFSFKSMTNLNAYTKLLIHSNTTDGSTTFTDSSDSGHTITPIGDTQHDTAQYKFGSSSILFDSNDRLGVADSDEFNLGSSSFTIDFWIRFSSFGLSISLFRHYESSTKNISFYFNDTSKSLGIEVYDPSLTTVIEKSWDPSADTWYHIAFVRNGTLFTIYVDGRSIGSETSSITFPEVNGAVNVNAAGLSGWYDEFRLVVGKAMWASEFVPAKGMYS